MKEAGNITEISASIVIHKDFLRFCRSALLSGLKMPRWFQGVQEGNLRMNFDIVFISAFILMFLCSMWIDLALYSGSLQEEIKTLIWKYMLNKSSSSSLRKPLVILLYILNPLTYYPVHLKLWLWATGQIQTCKGRPSKLWSMRFCSHWV